MEVVSVLYRTAAFGRGSFRHERSTAVSRPGHLRTRNAVIAPAATVDSVAVQDKGIDARSWYSRFDELLSQQGPPCKVGDRITGTVISVDVKGAFVDVGGKAAAYASLDDLSMAKLQHASEAVWPGAVREFAVMGERANGSFYLSLKALEENLTWMRLRQLQEDNVSVQVAVKSSNRGGLLVEYMNVLGFIPMSHLNRGNSTQPEELIGKQLNAKLLEVDQERMRLVLSNRQASFNSMRKFTVGDVVEGVVSKIAPYGAFLDIDDGVLGLLHVSQISHDRVVNVDRVVSVGDKLKVLILSQDRTNGRVSLSTKKLEPRPGDMLRSPQLVYEHASEMAALFRDRVAAAERTAREEEARLNAEME